MNKRKDGLVSSTVAQPRSGAVAAGTMALAKWSSLSPLAQMTLAFSCPGSVNAPFVEANGSPSRVPTAVIHGELDFANDTNFPNTRHLVLFNHPQMGYSVDQPGAGVQRNSPTTTTTSMSFTMNQGESFSSVYGASTMFSRYKILAQRHEWTFSAPEATLAGTVWIGSIQVSALVGTNVVTLIDNATESFALKDRCKWETRSFISDRTLVHDTATLSSVADEWISYCVISPSPSVNITTGAAADYRLYLKSHANIIWNPVVQSPVMNGIALRPPDSVEPPPKAQVETANIIQSRAADPIPAPKSWVAKVVSALAAGASAATHFTPWAAPISAGLSALSGLFSDPACQIPCYQDRMARLADIMHIFRGLPEGDEADETLHSEALVSMNRLYNLWNSKQQASVAIRRMYSECVQETETTRKGTFIRYKKPDGSYFDHTKPTQRSSSQGRTEQSTLSDHILRF